MNGFTAVLDACVLYPAPLRDLLVQMGCLGMFRAKWTEAIHSEWIEALLLKEPHRSRERLEHVRDLMNESVLDANVTGYESLVGSLNLPDPNDRHVLAAAIRCNADAIVTFNKKDFPQSTLDQFGIEAIHPDDFICSQLSLDIVKGCSAARICRERLTRLTFTVDQYLSNLKRQRLPNAVHRLHGSRDLL
jgi:predicted nucleic acid-binding protein